MKREELGKRIKRARESRRLTLKAVEGSSGISATHVSEIERGRTSPTLGALLRIARALGKDPAYFVEDEELADVSRLAREDRLRESLPEGAGTIDRLTAGIPGGCLQACYSVLAPGGRHRAEPHSHDGDEAAIVLAGSVVFTVDGQSHRLSAGDAIHVRADAPHAYTNASDTAPATMIWVCSARGRI
jgi:transcriptional regulator with XRE-family HTH domain